MTIDEAIKHSTWLADETILDPLPKYREALKLGIEALIAWRQYRSKRAPANLYLLPGETES